MEQYRIKQQRGKNDNLVKQEDINRDPKQRPKYMFQSRHQHAVRRLRGKDGKFLASNFQIIQLALNINDSKRRKKEEENQKIYYKTTAPLQQQNDSPNTTEC